MKPVRVSPDCRHPHKHRDPLASVVHVVSAVVLCVILVGCSEADSEPRGSSRGPFRLAAGPTGSEAEAKPALVKEEGLKVIEISEPGTLSQSDTKYVLTQDITTSGTAFTIAAGVRNTILDLGGHTVVYNSEPLKGDQGNTRTGQGAFGVYVAGRGIENIVIRRGTLVQGKGGSPGAHAINIRGGKGIEIARMQTRVHGPSTSNISAVWGGPDGRIHDNYMENGSRTTARGLFAPTGIMVSQTQPDWEIYNNTIIGGHTAISIWANALKDHQTRHSIHHNFVSPRRVHGIKAPQGILCFGSAGNHIYENEISTDDARGINLQGRGSGWNDVHNNLIACRYSSKATEGNYVENRCYGYWERDGEANKLHDNVWIVNNEVMGDRTSNTIGIVATTTGGDVRLKSAQYTNNRILCFHRDPNVDVVGFAIKRSDKDVVVSGNEVVARTTAFRVIAESDGVQIKGNGYFKPASAASRSSMFSGDCVRKCALQANREVTLKPSRRAPAKPTGLVAVLRHEAVELRWTRNPENDVIGYNVYADGKKINPYPVGGRFYVHLDVKPGDKHIYRVSALNLSGKESPGSASLEVVMP